MKFAAVILFALVACAFGDVPIDGPEIGLVIPNLREQGLWATAGRIVGGGNAAAGAAPFQVSLRRSNSHFCGGSIVNSRWILTAAHCTTGASANSITVVVGTNRLSAGGVGHVGLSIVNHPNFNGNTLVNDVALIQTQTAIAMNTLVQPIALTSANHGGGYTATLTGWGRTSTNGPIPDNLQTINLQTITQTDCANRLASVGQVGASQICTLTRAGEGACNGDSGGPLTIGGQQAGIVSWGLACARGYPDVFTRVYSFRSWIVGWTG